MATAVPMFEKIVKILPSSTLEDLAHEYAVIAHPWNASRGYLEASIISAENEALRIAVAELVLRHLRVRAPGGLENA